MWPFTSKKSLRDSGIFEGFIDWHSHILPGVDDGIKKIEDSLKVLEVYESLGFKKVWLTPHIMEEYPNETQKLKDVFESLKSRWKGNLEIELAAENMLDNMFEDRVEKNDFLPIGADKEYLLVETSYYTPPYGMEEMIEKARKKGYHIVLAHPERYRYMDENDYKKLKEEGVLFQMNILSIVGAYGETAKKKAEWLLEKNMVDFLGTDIHNLDNFKGHIDNNSIKSKHIEKLKNLELSEI